MNGDNKYPDNVLTCAECREGLQEYLEGTLTKQTSLRFFLHLRDCAACQSEHDKLQALFQLMDNLPEHPVPEGFDAPILASVPYAAYREMEPLRRERVPVFLEEHFLPAVVRSVTTRLVGAGLAAAVGVVYLLNDGPAVLPVLVIAGVIPEFLVRLQSLGRRAALAVRRSTG